MPDHTPPVGQQPTAELDDLRAENAKLIRWHREDETALAQQRATIGRLRAEKQELGELAARRESELITLRAELARHVQCNDCGAVGEVFTGDDGLAYLDPSGQIGHPAAVSAAVEGE